MWPFDRKKRTQARFIRQMFSKYISQNVIEELIQNPSKAIPQPERRNISFIVFQVRDNVLKYIDRAHPIVMNLGGVIEVIACSLALATFGQFPQNTGEEVKDNRAVAAVRLSNVLGSDVRLVHGSAQGLVGNIGTSRRLSYGSLLPNFGPILERLVNLDFGQSAAL